MLRLRSFLPLLLFSSAFVFGQEFSETVEVRVVNIEAVVTDRDGNRVHGLTRDDFEILENGKPQAITNFSEFGSEPATAALPSVSVDEIEVAVDVPPRRPRRIILFADDIRMTKFKADEFFASLRRFLDRNIEEGDEVMLATWDNRLNVRVPFTPDPADLEREIRRLYFRALPIREREDLVALDAELAEFERERQYELNNPDLPQTAERNIQGSIASANEMFFIRMKRKTAALNGLMTRFGGIDARKIFVLMSQDLPLNPHLTARKPGPNAGIAGQWSTYDLLQSLIRTANAHDITIHTIHPRGLANSMMGADVNMSADEAVSRALSGADERELENSTRSLALVAAETGGTMAAGPKDVALQLDTISADLESYYFLGYKPKGWKRDRKIEVRVRNRDYVVRARSGFVERSREEQLQDQVVANLFDRTSKTSFDIEARAVGRRDDPKSRQLIVPIEVKIPVRGLTLMPEGKRFRGNFSVYVAAANEKGDVSDVVQRTQKLDIRDSDLAAAQEGHVTYQLELKIRGTTQTISVMVVDNMGGGIGLTTIAAP